MLDAPAAAKVSAAAIGATASDVRAAPAIKHGAMKFTVKNFFAIMAPVYHRRWPTPFLLAARTEPLLPATPWGPFHASVGSQDVRISARCPRNRRPSRARQAGRHRPA